MSDAGLCVAGIDVGTTKICTVIGRHFSGRPLEIVGVGLSPCAGLKSGIIVDRESAVDSIKESVKKAEEMAEVVIEGAYVGITGDHVRSINVVGRVHTGPDSEVTADDIEQAKQSALDSVPLPVEREVIHSIVREFSVDGTSGVSRPLGMSGRRLDALLHVVTGMSTVIANARRCVEEADIQVQAQILEPIATARAVLTDAERDIGVLIVDIGGGTTDVAVFVDNAICHTAAVPLAGDRITRDIAEVLRVSRTDAEALKCRFGAAIPDLVPEGDLVHVSKADGHDFDRVPRRLIAEIMQARLSEIFDMVKQEAARAPVPKIGGIVLSGGGSLAPGTGKLASRVFDGSPVRTSEPRNLTGLAHLVNGPMYATGVGLAMVAAEEGIGAAGPDRPAASTAATVRSWIGELWDRLLALKPW